LDIYPTGVFGEIDNYWPFILTTWHGQSFILPFAKPLPKNVRVLVSGSADGQFLARVLSLIQIPVIVGSGAGPGKASRENEHSKTLVRKRSIAAFYEMLDALRVGDSVASTADVPKFSRKVGRGIVSLARRSGRPIIPIAIMTSYRIVLDSWDKALLNLPFGRVIIVVGKAIFVEDTDDAAILAGCQQELEIELNVINAQAADLAAKKRDTQ